MGHWKFSDPRLAYTVQHSGTNFSKPTISSTFTITPASPLPNPTTPASVVETLTPSPNYSDANLSLGVGWGARTLARLNLDAPGRTYVFNRYWNVSQATGNPALKVIAVHVTYSSSRSSRGVVTAYTSVSDDSVLADLLTQ
jgi:hypothetical protein